MKRLTVLAVYFSLALGLAVGLFLAMPGPAGAQQYGPGTSAPTRPAPAPAPVRAQAAPVRRAPARAGGPELALVAGALGTLGVSSIAGGTLLRRRKAV